MGMSLRMVPPAPGAQVLSRRELQIVAAVAEAMFPGGHGLPSAAEARVAERVDGLVAWLLEGPQPAAFRYALRVLEVGTEVSRGSCFSSLTVDERREVLAIWMDPDVLPRRLMGDAFRTVLSMAYFDDPGVRAATGWRAGCGGGG